MTFVRSPMLLLLLVPVVCVAQLEHAGCLSYEPAFGGIHGKLVRKTFAGPPNYHDIREGDEAETVWLVKLDRPICVKQDGAKPDLYPVQKNVRRVQLVLNKEDGERAKTLLGTRVVATGLLVAAHTRQYHTPVLLKVTYLDLPHWR
jgi:hypothetical protein